MKNKSKNVIIVGDESVRNLGSMANELNQDLDITVTVRGGADSYTGAKNLKKDTERLNERDTLICSYGVNDVIDTSSTTEIKQRIDKLITEVEKAKVKKVGILALPPHSDDMINEDIKEINKYISVRCRNSKVTLIDAGLVLADMAATENHIRVGGRRKIAKAIGAFAGSPHQPL